MKPMLFTIARRVLTACWLLVVGGLLAIGAVTHLATTFVIRGGSMEPALPIGSLIVEEVVSQDAIAIGDVITVRADNGVLLSHRVSRVLDLADGRYFELKGDANATPDPALVPSRAVIGRAAAYLPVAGYLAAMLGTPSGLISLLAMVGSGLALIWLAEELEQEMAGSRRWGPMEPEGPPRGAVA
jgi:signal peptidase I